MTEALLSMLVVAGLAAGYGLLHIGTDEGKGCGHCGGTCTYDPECAEGGSATQILAPPHDL